MRTQHRPIRKRHIVPISIAERVENAAYEAYGDSAPRYEGMMRCALEAALPELFTPRAITEGMAFVPLVAGATPPAETDEVD